MSVDLSPIVGMELDTIHIEGDRAIVFVLLDGTQFLLEGGMRLDSFDGELCDLLEGVVDTTRVHDFGGVFSKRIRVDVKMSTGAQVSFNFSGGLFDSLYLC